MAKHISDDSPLCCPKCGKPMEPHTLGEVTFHRCAGCTGLWLKAGAMEYVLSHKGLAQAVDSGSAAASEWTDSLEKAVLNCPDDHSRLIRMVNHKQPHVRYESCKVCGGVFLDAGELRDLASHSLLERLKSLFGRTK